MFARKENKEYRITDSMKSAYLNDGYDIYNEKGEIIEHSPKKTITINEHLKVVAELKTELEKANEVPKTAKDLKAANDALTKDNEDLKAKVADLEAQVQELTKAGEDNGKVQE